MMSACFSSRRAALCVTTSVLSLMLASGAALAQATDIGSVDVQSAGTGTGGLPPIAGETAVGSKAPAGSAPALAPSQGSLNAFQPGSIVSDKVIRDIVPPSSDYNETAKYTPGFVSSNSNGLLGDTKGGWRGLQDGQYNITFDGIPFGDANDPTHHSNAYFPGAFLGGVTIDRGPGAASQAGYATFGGTMALRSIDLSDKFGGSVDSSIGSFNTFTSALTVQTGLIEESGVRALMQYAHANSSGAIEMGKVNQDQFLAKVEKQFTDFKVTGFTAYGLEQYNNIVAITYPQLLRYGKSYGAVNSNPLTQQYVDYNDSQKQTDMEYIGIEGTVHDIHIDNKIYTYSYFYPQLQNNGLNQTIEGNASTANGGTITSVSIPTINGGKTKVNLVGVTNGDVIGYVKNNDYRAYGDILKLDRDFDAGYLSGTLRTGVWVEHIDNTRLQEYTDYTKGLTFPQLGNGLQESYKLDLSSHITSYQPFIEYEWKPLDRLSITPGYKFEAFTRDHAGLVNQTTLQEISYNATYTANLPFLAARYKLTEETTLYAQASKGFLAPTVSAYYVFNPAVNNIQPQTTNNFQAGAVYKSGRITADADVYQITAFNFPITTTTTTGQQYYQNGGTAQYRGMEAEGSYSIINGLSAYGSAALMNAKYIGGQFSGLRVGDAPDYTMSGGAVYDDGMFFGSLMQKFVGGFYGSNGQKAESAATMQSLNFVKAYNTTDFIVGVRGKALQDWGVSNTVKVRFGIYNILDHRNTTEIAGDPTGLNTANNTTLTYSFLPGRMFFGNVGIEF